jgi:hypothetical protein
MIVALVLLYDIEEANMAFVAIHAGPFNSGWDNSGGWEDTILMCSITLVRK